MTTDTGTPNAIVDLGEDLDVEELPVSHTVTIGDPAKNGLLVRVLANPHEWKLLTSQRDPIALVEAYCHPANWPSLDRWFSARRDLSNDLAGRILNAMLKVPTGHPTKEPSGSSDS